jgi:dipeptidyl aminopeptidase/acylaminoacyl peptidase
LGGRLFYSRGVKIAVLLASIFLAVATTQGASPEHAKLDWFRDDSGQIKKIATAADWQLRRRSILDGMQKVMGPLLDRSHLATPVVQVLETLSYPTYKRELVTIDTLFDEHVTAYLYVPNDIGAKERRPAALALQPTGMRGKDIDDDTFPVEHGFAYSTELARLGYVVIAPDYPSFGEQKDYNFKTSRYRSGTMKAIADNMRCVDVLLARSDVDPKRIAVIGHSLGGHNSLFTAAFDERITAVVTSCGWTPFHYYYGGTKLVNWAQDRYMPAIRDVYHSKADDVPFDLTEVIGVIAPRAVFSNSPIRDANFEIEGVRSATPEIQSIYKLLGAADRFVVTSPDCEHAFPLKVRNEAYRFIERAFAKQP